MLMDTSCEKFCGFTFMFNDISKLKSSTAGILHCSVHIHAVFQFAIIFCNWILESYKTLPIEPDRNHNITLPEITHSLLAKRQCFAYH